MMFLPNSALLYYLMSKLIISDCRCLNTRYLWRTEFSFLLDRMEEGQIWEFFRPYNDQNAMHFHIFVEAPL